MRTLGAGAAIMLLGIASPDAIGRDLTEEQPHAERQTSDDALPPAFRGQIVYEGSYEGKAIIPVGFVKRTLAMRGDFEITITFDGDRVSGSTRVINRVQGDNAAPDPDSFTGTREGTACRLTWNDGTSSTDYCGRTRFRKSSDDTNEAKQRFVYSIEAPATEFSDHAERDRRAAAERSAAEEREKAEIARIASLPAASAKQSRDLEDAVYADSEGWIMNRYDTGSMGNVRIVSPGTSPGNATLRGEYSYNKGSKGWVEAQFDGGKVSCLNYWDKGVCLPPRGQASAGTGKPNPPGSDTDPWKCIEVITNTHAVTGGRNSILGPTTTYSQNQELSNVCDFAVDIYTSDDPKEQACPLNMSNFLTTAMSSNPMTLGAGRRRMYSGCQGKVVKVVRR